MRFLKYFNKQKNIFMVAFHQLLTKSNWFLLIFSLKNERCDTKKGGTNWFWLCGETVCEKHKDIKLTVTSGVKVS